MLKYPIFALHLIEPSPSLFTLGARLVWFALLHMDELLNFILEAAYPFVQVVYEISPLAIFSTFLEGVHFGFCIHFKLPLKAEHLNSEKGRSWELPSRLSVSRMMSILRWGVVRGVD